MASNKTPKERKFVSVSKTAPETIERTQKIVEKPVKREDLPTGGGKTPKGRATGLRIIAVILWLAAIAFEFLVISYLNGTLYLPGDQMTWLIVGIGLDLVCVVIGSFIWKHSNRIDPVSEKNKLKFILWNNMGVIAAIIAFLPLVIILLKDKKLDAKVKKIVSVIAAIAMVAAIGLSVDYNPVSSEDLEQAQQDSTVLGTGTAYWTQWGRSYHFDPDCRTLLNSATIYSGTVDEAFAAHRSDPCDFCAGGGEGK